MLRVPTTTGTADAPDAADAADDGTTSPRATGAADRGTTHLRVADKAPAGPAPAEPEAERPAAPPAPDAPPDSARDPLELLAALTNRPPPPPTPWRTAVRRFKIWTPLVLLLLIVLAVVQSVRPLPEPVLDLTAAESYAFEGDMPEVPWPAAGQATLSVAGLGTFGSSGEQEPIPIASVAKVMTAYVILRDHPIEGDGTGAEITVDQLAEDEAALSEQNESTVVVRAGSTITQEEALQAIMIASANNVARLLARWDAGSEEAFVEKMNEAAAELGMDDTTYTDPSGLMAETVSTSEDQTRLAQAVMEYPVFRDIVILPEYTDSLGVTHPNWNHLVPLGGVVGIKTGTTTAAGGNLMFAARQEVGGTSQLIVGAVLGQPPHPSDNSILTGARESGRALMTFAQEQLRAETVLAAGDVVGEVDDGLGGRTPVTVTEDVQAVGWPGLEVGIELNGGDEGVPSSADAGAEVGQLTVGDGPGQVVVPLALEEALAEPGFSARLTRIG
ncbi:D-alanyl-D-alanine carboxypeptidase [Streptomyces marincola]|uniref:D-alanyl-D-alanine carboxypeptidase n=2 Tax=Streptomyces marincola TaxID=2878388 RepID=A0A1W7D623_9ACTN|nr:D-alanyl-D-alanine carboxypeptidase [Streptomyces marincola]